MSEKAVNRPLSGAELKQLLASAFKKLIENEGLLADRVAYGRCAFQIRLTLHTGNVHWPTQVTTVDSDRHPPLKDLIDDGETAVRPEPIPLTNQPDDAALGSTELTQKIDSPNVERLRAGMPIPVERRQPDSTIITEHIEYPPDDSLGPPDITLKDVTEEARKDLGLS